MEIKIYTERQRVKKWDDDSKLVEYYLNAFKSDCIVVIILLKCKFENKNKKMENFVKIQDSILFNEIFNLMKNLMFIFFNKFSCFLSLFLRE